MAKKPTKTKLECTVKNCKKSHRARPIKWKELAAMSLFELLEERNSRTTRLVLWRLIDIDGAERISHNLDAHSMRGSVLPAKTESEMREMIIDSILEIEDDRRWGWED